MQIIIYHNGTTYEIPQEQIYVPPFWREEEQAEAERYELRNEPLT